MMTEATEESFNCPRCDGTGVFALKSMPNAPPNERFSASERCKPCWGTGRVTRQQWDAWCYHFGAPASNLGARSSGR